MRATLKTHELTHILQLRLMSVSLSMKYEYIDHIQLTVRLCQISKTGNRQKYLKQVIVKYYMS